MQSPKIAAVAPSSFFSLAPNGFTAGFKAELDKRRGKEILIVPVDAEALDVLVRSIDWNAALKALHQDAVIGAARPSPAE